jgi:tyrosinase
MKLLSLSAWVLCTSGVGLANPIREPDREVSAASRILELQTQYQHNVLGKIGQRRSGCTTQTIQRRKEW